MVNSRNKKKNISAVTKLTMKNQMPTIYHCRSIAVAALCVFAAATAIAQDFKRMPLPSTHPFVGHWRADFPQLACFEEYQVRRDGTRSVTSGKEEALAEFAISLAPSSKGFYKWTDKFVKSNGKPDCTGTITKIGHVAVGFLLIQPDGDRFMLCSEEDIKSCIGPYVRLKTLGNKK